MWDVDYKNKSDMEIANEGLNKMETYMNELGLVMNITDLGATEDMLNGIVEGTFILEGGYKVLTKHDVLNVLKESLK